MIFFFRSASTFPVRAGSATASPSISKRNQKGFSESSSADPLGALFQIVTRRSATTGSCDHSSKSFRGRALCIWSRVWCADSHWWYFCCFWCIVLEIVGQPFDTEGGSLDLEDGNYSPACGVWYFMVRLMIYQSGPESEGMNVVMTTCVVAAICCVNACFRAFRAMLNRPKILENGAELPDELWRDQVSIHRRTFDANDSRNIKIDNPLDVDANDSRSMKIDNPLDVDANDSRNMKIDNPLDGVDDEGKEETILRKYETKMEEFFLEVARMRVCGICLRMVRVPG